MGVGSGKNIRGRRGSKFLGIGTIYIRREILRGSTLDTSRGAAIDMAGRGQFLIASHF